MTSCCTPLPFTGKYFADFAAVWLCFFVGAAAATGRMLSNSPSLLLFSVTVSLLSSTLISALVYYYPEAF